MSHLSRLSANTKVDNKIIPGAVHRYPGIYFIAEENFERPELGDRRQRLYDQLSPQMGFLTSK